MGKDDVSISKRRNSAVVGLYLPLCLFLQHTNKTLCPHLEWKAQGVVSKPACLDCSAPQTVALVFDQPLPLPLEWETPFPFPPSTRSPTLVRFSLAEPWWRQRLTISCKVAQIASWQHLHPWSHWTLSWPWPMPATLGCWRPLGQPGVRLSQLHQSIHPWLHAELPQSPEVPQVLQGAGQDVSGQADRLGKGWALATTYFKAFLCSQVWVEEEEDEEERMEIYIICQNSPKRKLNSSNLTLGRQVWFY